MGDRSYTFDANNAFSDGAAAYTASGYAQSGGADGVVDTGGNQNVTITLPSIADVATITPQRARIDAVAVVFVTAAKVSSSNEVYKLLVLGSNDPNFAAGNVQMLGAIELGFAGSNDIPNGITTPAPAAVGGSVYEILFCTEQNNVKYQYVKLYNVLAGTTPSISYRAFMAVLPRE
jgi:hypothetical protein